MEARQRIVDSQTRLQLVYVEKHNAQVAVRRAATTRSSAHKSMENWREVQENDVTTIIT